MKKKTEKKYTCSICFSECKGVGNNAQPVNDGMCCDACNESVVIIARVQDASTTKRTNEAIEIIQKHKFMQITDNGKDLNVLIDFVGFLKDCVIADNRTIRTETELQMIITGVLLLFSKTECVSDIGHKYIHCVSALRYALDNNLIDFHKIK